MWCRLLVSLSCILIWWHNRRSSRKLVKKNLCAIAYSSNMSFSISLVFYLVVLNLGVRLRGGRRKQKALTEVAFEQHVKCGLGKKHLKTQKPSSLFCCAAVMDCGASFIRQSLTQRFKLQRFSSQHRGLKMAIGIITTKRQWQQYE